MHILEKTKRFRRIENRFNAPVKDILYQMHWLEGLRHRDIAQKLGVPRPTLTKWFYHFKVPTQSCRRFTDKNLTSWLYKTGKLIKKPKYNGPDRRIQRTKNAVDVDFFKKWSPQMAYVLGYFCADGCMYENTGRSKYINFVSTDYEILKKVRTSLDSRHIIAAKRQNNPRWKPTFWLQIGCKEIYEDLIKLGLRPNKEFRLKIPKIPLQYVRDFVRGYFDGDGCVSFGIYKRKKQKSEASILMTRFTSCSKQFLSSLKKRLQSAGGLQGGYIVTVDKTHYLTYSIKDSIRLFRYMYKGVSKEQYLERKYNKFHEAFRVLKRGDVV